MSRRFLGIAVALCTLQVSLFSGQNARAVPVNPGIPDHSWLFDEGTGTTAFAQTGGINGTLETGASYTSSTTPFAYAGNYAVALDGSTGSVNLTAASAFEYVSSTFTASFWVKAPATALRSMLLAKANAPGVGPDHWAYQVELVDITSLLAAGVLTGSNNARYEIETLSSSVDNDVWRHVAVIMNTTGTGDVRLFVDGVERATTVSQSNFTLNGAYTGAPGIPLRLGARSNGAGAQLPLTGLVDELALFNRELTADEIEWLSQNTLNPPFVPEPSSALLMCGLLCAGCLRIRRHR